MRYEKMIEEQQKLEVVTLLLVRWRSSKISEENINKKSIFEKNKSIQQ